MCQKCAETGSVLCNYDVGGTTGAGRGHFIFVDNGMFIARTSYNLSNVKIMGKVHLLVRPTFEVWDFDKPHARLQDTVKGIIKGLIQLVGGHPCRTGAVCLTGLLMGQAKPTPCKCGMNG